MKEYFKEHSLALMPKEKEPVLCLLRDAAEREFWAICEWTERGWVFADLDKDFRVMKWYELPPLNVVEPNYKQMVLDEFWEEMKSE